MGPLSPITIHCEQWQRPVRLGDDNRVTVADGTTDGAGHSGLLEAPTPLAPACDTIEYSTRSSEQQRSP